MIPSDFIISHFRLSNPQKIALKKLGLFRLEDLLRHFPSRYSEVMPTKQITSLTVGETASIAGRIISAETKKAFVKKIPIAEVVIADNSGEIKCVWYSQAYMAKMYHAGQIVRASGKVAERKGQKYFANPEIEIVEKLAGTKDSLFPDDPGSIAPSYSQSRGISSLWVRHAIRKLLANKVHDKIEEPIPPEILKKYNLPSLASSLVFIHAPRDMKQAQASRKRFAFEEIFSIQISRGIARRIFNSKKGFVVKKNELLAKQFLSRFPFTPTQAQLKAFDHISTDFASGRPMMRLLEGDVGSGKTLVAALAAHATANVREKGMPLQVAYMAPTEILARQHFESFCSYFKGTDINIGLITGKDARKFPSKIDPASHADISRTQLLKWLSEGAIHILIGTHAVIGEKVKFSKLALAIIDEQHRFGTNQRLKLAQKHTHAPHFLSMTATPIPRSLALTIYGDLDLTLLDELPVGRKKVATEIIVARNRDSMYVRAKKELLAGHQAFVVCPRIDEPDPEKELALSARSTIAEGKRLAEKEFKGFRIAILHSKILPAEKDKIMRDFSSHKYDILVSTSVIEVGVNIPNATIMIIEGAERFGLAQLHQLRGRVARSSDQAYCFLASDSKTAEANKRLKALTEAKNGFELAELDLSIRGAGELSGNKQWGLSDVAMEALKNMRLVEAAREEARMLLDADPTLANHKALAVRSHASNAIHFE